MKKDKILLLISNLKDIYEYEKLGVSNFLFPLENYSIGYETFSFDDIKDIQGGIYILANRLLTDDDIDEFLKLDIPSNIKGFIVEDIGLFEVLKNRGYELINYQNHLNNNYKTVNYWLKYYDSLVISTDITREEIEIIIKKSQKPLVLNTFLYPMIMYSRRRLISNFYRHLGRDEKYELNIYEKLSNSNFFMKESKYGTAVFNNKILDCRNIIDEKKTKNIKFFLFISANIPLDVMKHAINGEKIAETTNGFLDKKTVYRVGDLK